MQKFTVHQGLVAPMDRENVDTDAIIPKQFLKSIRKTGFGSNLFDEWRYLDHGEPGMDPASRRLPIVLPESTISRLFDEVAAFPGYQLTVDLERQAIVQPGGEEIAFDVQPFRKYCLQGGFDDIGLTLRQRDKIKAFEAERLAAKPWLAHTLNG